MSLTGLKQRWAWIRKKWGWLRSHDPKADSLEQKMNEIPHIVSDPRIVKCPAHHQIIFLFPHFDLLQKKDGSFGRVDISRVSSQLNKSKTHQSHQELKYRRF